jgi:hypothetical protein
MAGAAATKLEIFIARVRNLNVVSAATVAGGTCLGLFGEG